MNRAVQGDIVAVEVFSEQEWKAPTNEVVDQDCELVSHITQTMLTNPKATLKNDDADESDEEGERVFVNEEVPRPEVPSRAVSEKQPTGRVIGVIKRNWRAYVGPNSHCRWS
jgi:exosome complex exonuclease DIS3/RRP44